MSCWREAGTGIGKTLGYLAPATLWAEEAGGTVWVSTYTKALQRQLDRETRRHYPSDADFRRHVVDPQGPRELSLPAQPRGCAAGRLCGAGGGARAVRGALGGLIRATATWSAAICRAGCPPCSDAPGRPRSPTGAANASMPAAAFPELLHRARGQASATGRHRHRQPCAGHDLRRARPRRPWRPVAHRVRRGPSSVRRRRRDLRRGADRAGGDRTAALGDRAGEQCARGRRRGLAARLIGCRQL